MQINYLNCILSILMKISENKGKLLKKNTQIQTEFCLKLSLLHVIISSMIQFDKSFHTIVTYKIVSFANSLIFMKVKI